MVNRDNRKTKTSPKARNGKSRRTIKRGRPKGQSNDKRSYGPLGDLLRSRRLAQGKGLAEVARVCGCSVQFISNIEHGRAPLPWKKAEKLSKALGITLEELQAANLSVRSDFKKFALMAKSRRGSVTASRRVTPLPDDPELQQLIQRYLAAPEDQRRKFVAEARNLI